MSTAISVPAIQRVKGWMSSDKMVELVAVLISFTSGMGVAAYYVGYNVVDSFVVGLFAVIGAETIFQLLKDKLKTYKEVKGFDQLGDSFLSQADLDAEEEHLLQEE